MYKYIVLINFVSFFTCFALIITSQNTLYCMLIFMLFLITFIILRLFYKNSEYFKSDGVDDDGYSI